MQLKELTALKQFLSTYLSESDADNDPAAVQKFLADSSADQRSRVISEARSFITKSASIVEDLGMEANRWFGDADEAKTWLEGIVTTLDSGEGADSGNSIKVKDSNGTLLQEGDSVTVIKDLKVKGGSSDLKRGTLIKKIHLIDDPDNIECNVGGSTLVLKTCFLKKA